MSTNPVHAADGIHVLHAARDCPGVAAVDIPALAARLRDTSGSAACVLGVAHAGVHLDWLATPHASGWLAPSPAGAAVDFTAVEFRLRSAVARGFVAADAAVLARTPAGAALPTLSWDDVPPAPVGLDVPRAGRPLGLYAIAAEAAMLLRLADAGVRTVQLRVKTPAAPDAAWHAALRTQAGQAVRLCREAGVTLFINDHWELARDCGAHGVHLGQEDLLAMSADARAALLASGLALGVSSHSPWELSRAIGLAPSYIACGPVWSTITKDMPWLPQGLDNLAWWCRMAGAPVVAIGGVLAAGHVRQAIAAGADGVCLVRGFGADPAATTPALLAAVDQGLRDRANAPPAPGEPHPSLPH